MFQAQFTLYLLLSLAIFAHGPCVNVSLELLLLRLHILQSIAALRHVVLGKVKLCVRFAKILLLILDPGVGRFHLLDLKYMVYK